MKKHIPNFITSLNLTSGFIAIIFVATGDTITASWLILAAMILDFLDGFAARLLKAYSEIGKELDSLADIVSFGVAPGFILYELMRKASSIDGRPGVIIMIVASVMPVCAALRLAKFNTDTTQSSSFKGLPTPANALAVISLVIAQHYSDLEIFSRLNSSFISLAMLTFGLSLLMVSRLPLMSLKIKNLGIKTNRGLYLLFVLVGISLIIFGIAAVPLIIPIYIIASLTSLLFPQNPI
jgi:CDP-diacylglycerol---serine O-phosphatidyltransferase